MEIERSYGPYNTRLEVGDIIKVHGFIMLKNLDDGNKYHITGIAEYKGQWVYEFKKFRGKKLYGHYVHNIDSWVKTADLKACCTLNYIEILNRK